MAMFPRLLIWRTPLSEWRNNCAPLFSLPFSFFFLDTKWIWKWEGKLLPAAQDVQCLQTAQSPGQHTLRTDGICVLEERVSLTLYDHNPDRSFMQVRSHTESCHLQQWGLLFRSTISISTVTSWTGKDRTCNIKGCSRKYWLLWDLAGPSCVPQYTGLPHEALTTKEKQTNLEFPTVTKVLSSLQGQSSWDWYLKQS